MSEGQDDQLRKDQIAQWLARAGRGDEQAWRLLVEEFSPRVFGLLRAQRIDADLAEELTQSVFATLVEKLSGYTEQGQFEAWIFRVAINRLRDEMRRRSRHARSGSEDGIAAAKSSGMGGEGYRTVEESQVVALEGAMAELSRADREIIDLRHTGGLSFKQIAHLLKEPVGTLLARHHRALSRLREMIELRSKRRG
ncbi:MAG: sigma-70 family RNA polymerase sigma factor [Phycisphaerales bacterium]|nr:sigma-70 family RNA polymerase sigma factor [Phycisphaerales bacterium]